MREEYEDDSGAYDARSLRQESEDERIARIVHMVVRSRPVEVKYREARRDPLLVTIIGGLVVAFIVGSIVGYGQLQAVKTSMDDLRHEYERQNPKTVYRGGPDVEPGAH